MELYPLYFLALYFLLDLTKGRHQQEIVKRERAKGIYSSGSLSDILQMWQ